jgi:hypothetical protein
MAVCKKKNGSRLDEKILNTAVYKVSNSCYCSNKPISTISAYNTIGVSYTINSGPDDLGFDWTITKSISGAVPTVVRQEIKPVRSIWDLF